MKRIVFLSVATITALVLIVSSCKKEPQPSTGDALFEYTANGLTVQFTNKSTIENPKSFLWDFGDNATSTEENPTHTYAKKGEYTVKLTVTDQADAPHSVQTKLTVDKGSPVKLDDDSFDDWANVNDFVMAPGSGVIKKVKLDYDVNYIYLYVEAEWTDSIINDIMFDTDLDTNTGFISHFWPLVGADLLAEGTPMDKEGGAWGEFTYAGQPGEHGWNWNDISEDGNQVIGTFELSGGIERYEMGFSRQMPGLGIDKDSIKIAIFTSNFDWLEIGLAPDTLNNDDGFVLNLDLTK